MKKTLFVLLLFITLISCSSSKTFLITSDGESFDALTQITDSENPVFYPSGGDFGENLVFAIEEDAYTSNIFMKDRVLSNAFVQKTDGNNVNVYPSYSPANDRIAFQHWDKTNYDIYYIDVKQGKAITQITNTDDNEFNPSWSPDGNLIVFEKGVTPRTYTYVTSRGKNVSYSGVAVRKNQIWIKNIKTNELKMIGTGSFPRISPNGKSIAYIKYDLDKNKAREVGTLWVMSLEGDSPSQLTNGNLGYATRPNWSPNGKRIVFELTKKNKTDSDLYTINTDGESLKQYTTNKSNDFAPIWTADNYIYFCSDRGSKARKYQIWRFKINE
jgi:Tol biopolymer transport system component